MITMDDKYRLEDFGFRAYLDHEHDATPEIRRKTISIPGRPGSWNFGSEIGERHFNIPLKVSGQDQVNLQYKQSAFIAFLFNAYGRPRPIKLSFDYEPDKYYIVELSGGITPSTAIYHFRNFGLSLVASDPNKYLYVETNEIHWDSATATFNDTWSIDSTHVEDELITAPVTVEPYVNGLALTPTILITGSADSLTFQANGKSFSLKKFANATIEIRREGYTVLKDGVETLSLMTGSFLTLLPGLNQVQITGENMNFKLSIIFRDNYL